ncbi:urea transporter [Dyadobacter sp. 676]|uniref:Urea transporter n=1 Tax=Dyadobacter sp. 676 TaxID=3088362 RepID=A0AAU8FHQ6_9BACT
MEILEKRLPFISEMLKGVGQIILQDNAWTGLLFLAGIFCNDYKMGAAGQLVRPSDSKVDKEAKRILSYILPTARCSGNVEPLQVRIPGSTLYPGDSGPILLNSFSVYYQSNSFFVTIRLLV